MNNNAHATFDLVTKYESSLSFKNSAGVKAYDIGKWHPDIKDIFDKFYEDFDITVKKMKTE